ncbi:MAG: hypothetical protein DRJ55_01295 [Thermoprotei archaeon]|nr:MAG: hypothetical protein DRJ55_01295 [Thermoprotei archaeon]
MASGAAFYRNGKLNFLPVVKAVLRAPDKAKSLDLELIVDTGFQGGVLISLRDYLALGLNLFEEDRVIARAAVGRETWLRFSRVEVEIAGISAECRAYTSLGVRKPLLGREFLKRAGLHYEPPSRLEIGFAQKG